ncbi:MAG: twin-arginine translocase TatA/TatE family subunit [Bacteroidia bacterium]|jgi:sec-independent protein translocase protein TatA|nr:twin-arginine translocase TatA/TatE family subunit [Bacteroidia bacterium]
MVLLTAFPLFLNLGSGEIFLIVILIVLFFGTDKLPEMVRGFARGMREMRNAAGEIQREIETSVNEVQRDINLQQHIDEIAESARTMANSVDEEVKAIDAANTDAVPPVTVIYNPQNPKPEVADDTHTDESGDVETGDVELPQAPSGVSETPPSGDSPEQQENPLVPPHIISRKG